MPKEQRTIIVNELAFRAIKNNAISFLDKSQVKIHLHKGIIYYQFSVDPDVFAYIKNELKTLTPDSVSAFILRMTSKYNKGKEES